MLYEVITQVERGVVRDHFRLGNKGLSVQHLGRDGQTLPVPVVLDPQVLFRLSDRDLRDRLLLLCLGYGKIV